jgi:hypothetical protein
MEFFAAAVLIVGVTAVWIAHVVFLEKDEDEDEAHGTKEAE